MRGLALLPLHNSKIDKAVREVFGSEEEEGTFTTREINVFDYIMDLELGIDYWGPDYITKI